MNLWKTIMPIVKGMPHKQPVSPPMFGAEVIAGLDVQSDRTEICLDCVENVDGVCTGCCGGVKVTVAVILKNSKCPKRKWKI